MKRKIFVVGGDREYANWMEGELVHEWEDADLIVFTGGTDVSPSLYGEKAHPATERSNSVRDANEVLMFQKARSHKIPMVGICRGAQFLCVMAGGKLVQHQFNGGPHYMTIKKDEEGPGIFVTSDHHQAQYPWGLNKDEFEVLGWTRNQSPYHQGGNKEEMVEGVIPGEIEVEDVYYPKINALGIQSHPEWLFGSHGEHVNSSIAHHRELLKLLERKE